jgi:signal transduction histidine kinase/ligand-binding sensor domain-containing protein/AraC-like DNA-binding protein/ActR/RegA family two-component response regulator
MKIRYLTIIFILSLLRISVFAYYPDNYRFRIFSPKGGFYYDGVQEIVQDNDGFIWILLNNDLQRFDGYEYKRYATHFQNPGALGLSGFRSIAKDKSGRLYVSNDNGLFKYDKPSDTFEKVVEERLSKIAIDRENNIWCIYDRLLYRLNQDNKKLEALQYEDKPIQSVGYFSDSDSGMYFSSFFNRIYYADYRKPDEITLFYLLPRDHSISGIQLAGKYLYVLTGKHGVLQINTSTKQIEKRLEFKNQEEHIPVKTFYVDKNNRIWIGTQKGLYVLDSSTGQQQLYLHSKSDMFSLPNQSVWTIVGDSRQNIWIGTYAGGLCYVDLDEELRLKTYTPFESALNHNLVSSFSEDGHLLWLGTEGGGLNCLDRLTGKFTYYKSGNGSNSLSYNNVKSLTLDTKKRLWIAMYMGGLDCFDTKTKKFRHFHHEADNQESLYGDNLRKIVLTGDSGLWVAYQANKVLISFFSFETEKFTHYFFDKDEYIFDLKEDSSGNLWFITHRCLYKMNRETKLIEDVSSQSIEMLNAQSVGVDADDNVWIGTVGGGLIKYDVSTSEFIPFRDLLQFNIFSVHSICSDDSGCLWLGTNNGLFRYHVKDNTFLRFDESDGLQGQVYYPLASLKGSSGELYFGGTNGFTIIDQQSIRSNRYKPKAVISDFYINNVSAVPKLGKNSVEILLNHNEANFGFKFSSDNYLSPGKNRFKYRLRKYDDRWITTDAANRTVMYSKVPSGTYYFEVLAASNDGVWSDTPTVIKIKRKPAPWSSWFAYLCYTAVVLCVIAVILYHYTEKRKLKMQLYIDSLEQQKKEEIHQSQLRFFTNISHDFRTSISLILATLDNLKQEGLKEYYYRILHNNAGRLLNLVNETLDFRTLENGKMQLRIQPADVNRLVIDLASDFKDYAQKRHIQFEINCDSRLPEKLYIDKQVMEKVVMNLLNNSFKYTKDGGKVWIETYSDSSAFSSKYAYSHRVSGEQIPADGFLLVVRDTGIGISKDSIQSVFERYYQVDTANMNQHLGTGIGLALVKSLILLHNGSISIYSERDKGTDIAVCFPTNTAIYDPPDFVKIIEDTSPTTSHTPIENTDLPEPDEKPGYKRKVLLAEDDADLRRLLSEFLSRHYEILEAANGVEASAILEEKDIDLILSDIMMPLKDGITLCREVKSDMNTSHIPFIMLTAKTDLESKMEGAGSGADVYFEKPVDCHLLLLSIKNIFKHQQELRKFYAKNYYVDSVELSANEQNNLFLRQLVEIIDANLDQPTIDIHSIASLLSISRSKLYSKVKMLTDKSIVEFILDYRLRKAARLLVEEAMPVKQVIAKIGIQSHSYFIRVFKKEFGDTPAVYAAKHRKKEEA